MTPAANRGKASKTIPYTIPANGQVPVKATGSHIFIVESPVAVMVKMDGCASVRVAPGCGLDCEDGAFFESAEITNLAAYEITILVYVGFAAYNDRRAQSLDANTVLIGQPVATILANTKLTFSGSPSGNLIRRRQIVVSNMDAANAIYVLDENDNFCAAVFFGTSITLPTSGPLKIFNNTGAPVPVCISEIWYANI
jgi:hypothetical protein